MSRLRERMNRLLGKPSGGIEQTELTDTEGTETLQDVPPTAQGQEQGPAVCEERVAAEAQMAAAAVMPDVAVTPVLDAYAVVWQRLGVAERHNSWGSYLAREVRYPLTHRHGHHQLSELLEATAALAAFHPEGSGADDAEPAADNLLYLDLETTGLGAGAGNIPFMVGLAYVERQQLVIMQYLIRHPAEERAMLADLKAKLDDYRYLVTYNGRTFDWPVLASRFIINGLGRVELKLRHLDFLHPSRSIWRNTLASCKLSHVEEERLGILRVDDVPGSQAPEIYFRFLADANPQPLEGVFVHNELDMLAMACLSIRFGRLLAGRVIDEVYRPAETEELIRTGLWLERMNCAEVAEPLLERALEAGRRAEPCLLLLAARDKKHGNWERAVVLWQKVAQLHEAAPKAAVEANIELAMYCEHRVKDLHAALACAEAARELLMSRHQLQRADAKQRSEQAALDKRIDRLQRKLDRC